MALSRQSTQSNEFAEGQLRFERTYFREGKCMDFSSYKVFFDGNEIGALHLIGAITFQDVVYVGKNPLNLNEEVRKEAHIIKPYAEADFSRLDNARRLLGQ